MLGTGALAIDVALNPDLGYLADVLCVYREVKIIKETAGAVRISKGGGQQLHGMVAVDPHG